jgi:hypothetical protein
VRCLSYKPLLPYMYEVFIQARPFFYCKQVLPYSETAKLTKLLLSFSKFGPKSFTKLAEDIDMTAPMIEF